MIERMAIEGWAPASDPVLWPCVVFYFALLADPLPVPSGYAMQVPMPPLRRLLTPGAPGPVDSTIEIRCWQVATVSGIDYRAMQSIDVAMRQVVPAALLPDPANLRARASTLDPDDVDTYRTVAEMRAVVPMLAETPILDGFQRSASALREFHRAVSVAIRAQIPPFAVERLHQLVPFATAELDGRWHDRTGWVIAHPKLPHPVAPDLLTGADLESVGPHMDLLRRANPWSLFTERLLTGSARLDEGDFSTATIEAAIAIEGLIDDGPALAHWDAGTPVRAAYEQSRSGVVKRVRTHLPRALGDSDGLWSIVGAGPAARWKHDVADQRNLIVHRGHPSSHSDADAAITAAHALAHHIADRFLTNADRVPRAAVVLLGEARIKSAGRMTARIQAVAGLDRLDTFHQWQDSLVSDE